MPGIFEEVKITWAGVTYPIAANRVMGAIATVEEYVTLPELLRMQENLGRGLKLTPVAKAYAALLTYAGAKDLTDEKIYSDMFDDTTGPGAMMGALNGLLMLMVPPESLRKSVEAAKNKEGKQTRQARRAAARLSKKPTKQPSATGTSVQKISGNSIQ